MKRNPPGRTRRLWTGIGVLGVALHLSGGHCPGRPAVALLPPGGVEGPAATARSASLYPPERLLVLQVPPPLHSASPVEPSGLAWLPALSRYLIVSDDTGRGRHSGAPWVFLMDEVGRLDPAPAVLEGVAKVADLEAVAARPDGVLYLLASQNVSRHGKRPEARRQLLRVACRQGRFVVTASADLLAALEAAAGARALERLGLTERNDAGRLALNIEGAAWFDGGLLLGLKHPRPAAGAILWRLSDPDRFLERQALAPDQLTLFGHADLRTPDGRPAAVSDLAVDEEGRVYALSTVPGAGDKAQTGGLHRLLLPAASARQGGAPAAAARAAPGDGPSAAPAIVPVVSLLAFPGLKPEGLAAPNDGTLTIVFDGDGRLPLRAAKVTIDEL